MEYTYKKHPLTDGEKLWLHEAAHSESFDPRIAKVHLLGKLPDDFHSKTINPRLYNNGRLTMIGLWHADPKNPIFDQLDNVIRAIRKQIIEKPGIEQITAQSIATICELPEDRVARVLYVLSQLGHFYSSASGQGADSLATISLSDEDAYDEYLRYKSVDELLERYYVAEKPREKQWAATAYGVTTGYASYWEEDLARAYGASGSDQSLELKSIKPNTAFVLMAIDPSKPEIEDVYNAIKEACREFGINAYRADEIEHQDRITDLVLGEIRTCEFLIADLSYERPNVYYEVGYAHAVNKKPILYRRFGTRLHFDLSVHNVPEYKNATELRDLLRKRWEAILGRKAKTT